MMLVPEHFILEILGIDQTMKNHYEMKLLCDILFIVRYETPWKCPRPSVWSIDAQDLYLLAAKFKSPEADSVLESHDIEETIREITRGDYGLIYASEHRTGKTAKRKKSNSCAWWDSGSYASGWDLHLRVCQPMPTPKIYKKCRDSDTEHAS